MRERRPRLPRAAGALLVAVLWLPSPASAIDWFGWTEPVVEALTPAAGPTPFNMTFDVLIVRPAAAFTVAAGSVLVVPAVLLTAPGGIDPVEEAWERFITAPGEHLWGRPLGEF